MTTRSRWLVFLVSTPLVALVTLGGLLGASEPLNDQGFPELGAFQNVVSLVLDAYVEPVDVDRVMDGAMRGLTDTLDASSAFLKPDQVRVLTGEAALPAGGIGVVVTRQYYIRVVGVRDGSPAARAGLRTGDYIRAIDDRPTRDMSALEGRRLLLGEPGSSVSLLVIRGNAADPHEVTLTREAVNGPPVTTTSLDGGFAHVRVSSFASGVAPLREALEALSEQGAAGAVIDLRGTADGTPEVGAKAARLFVADGAVATLASRDADPIVTTAEAGDGAIAMPVVLLVSNGTAHAAEVFAAALADHDRAELVGQPTAGLAGVQRLVPLADRHALWLTYARYLRADGTPIHEQGLTPDHGVTEPYVEFGEPTPDGDPALDRAVARLKAVAALQPAA
jgi:carboxyl-terminal processing protease